MFKKIAITIVLLAVIFVASFLLLYQLSGGVTIEERLERLDKITFSVGNGSVMSFSSVVEMSMGNRTVEVERGAATVVIRGFEWPYFLVCSPGDQTQCGKILFPQVAIPREVIGVHVLPVPITLSGPGGSTVMTFVMHYEGTESLEMPWGPHVVLNYTNVTAGFPEPGTNSTVRLYYDAFKGYLVRGEFEISDGRLVTVKRVTLSRLPDLKGALVVPKPEEWNWSSP